MHLARWAGVLLMAIPGAASPRELIRLQGRVDVALAYSGRSLLWSPVRRATDVPVLYLLDGRASRRIWRSPSVPVPAGQRAGSAVVYSSSLAASGSKAAFVREATLIRPDGLNCHDCVAPIFAELFVGSPQGPLRLVEGRAEPLANDRSQHWVRSAAATGSSIVYTESIGTWWYTARSRVVLLTGGRRVAIASSRSMSFRDVKAAGRYVAWARQPDGCGAPKPPCRRPGVTVFDLPANRVSYRVSLNRVPLAFALDAGGKIAILVQRRDVHLVWASPRSRPRVVPIDAGVSDLAPMAMNRNRIVFVRVGPQRMVNTLLATDLRGRSTRLDMFRSPREAGSQVALRGRRVAWVGRTNAATSVLEARLP
jgi:hypothetical protein